MLSISSDIVDGALIHPTLPMSHIVEVVTIDKALLDATANVNILSIPFNPQRMYENPFFIIYARGFYFYTEVKIESNRYVLYAERPYYRLQGNLYYRGVGSPLLSICTIYIGNTSTNV